MRSCLLQRCSEVCVLKGRKRVNSSRSKEETVSEEKRVGGPGRAKCQVMKNIAEARPSTPVAPAFRGFSRVCFFR